MRAPELQLIDRLEVIKRSLLERTSSASSFSPAEYKKNLFSTITNMLDSGDESAQQDITLIQLALGITQRLVDLLIEKSAQARIITPEEFETIVTSLCDEQPKKSELADFVMMAFFALLKDYRESIVQVCGQYELTLLQDSAYEVEVADFSDSHFDVDGRVTLFRLREMKYILDLMLNKSVEELSQLHPVRDLPYIRHTTVSDEIVERIMRSQRELTPCLVSHIENTQQKLHGLMVVNKYPETATDIKAIIEAEAKLLDDIEESIAVLASIKAKLKVAGNTPLEQLEARLLNAIVVQGFEIATQLIQGQFAAHRDMVKSRMRAHMEMFGTGGLSPSDLNSLGCFSGTSREASRFGLIEQAVNCLVGQLYRAQLSAGESKFDFKLRDFVGELKERSNPFDSTMASFRNLTKLSGCVEQFKVEVEAFNTAWQQSSRPPQTAASPSSLFGSQQQGSTASTTSRVEVLDDSSDEENTQAAGF